MIYEEYIEMKQKPIVLQLAADGSNKFRNVYHFHPGIEIIYIHEGAGQIIIDQEIYPIFPGTLFMIRPFQPHFLQLNITKEQPYVRSLIKYEPNYFTNILKPFPNLSQFHHYLCHAPAVLQVQHLSDPDSLHMFLRNYKRQFESNPNRIFEDQIIERNSIFLLAFFQFIQPLWEEFADDVQPKTSGNPVIVEIMKWIEEHFEEEFQLEALAKDIHLSPNHVSYLFQKSTGYTVTEFLTIRRMKHAAVLLKTTSLSIQEIGIRCGYANNSYFCQVFKKNMGMTPTEYRMI